MISGNNCQFPGNYCRFLYVASQGVCITKYQSVSEALLANTEAIFYALLPDTFQYVLIQNQA
jgi:hypothetical protein